MKPAHVAIIMDGNGRWAKARGLPRTVGHNAGVEALRKVVKGAGELGLGWLTVYAFSSENWSRPKSEVSDLMGLLKLFIRRDLAELERNGVRVRMIGDKDSLQPDIRSLLESAETSTAHNSGLNLVIAFNYGGRDEIFRAARKLVAQAAAGTLTAENLTPERLAAELDTAGIPDPDLVVRTSGEQRLSNFLLWQAAYSELVFVPCFWPDFTKADLAAAIDVYARRERRFGGVAPEDVAL